MEFLSLKAAQARLSLHFVTLLEIACHGSIIFSNNAVLVINLTGSQQIIDILQGHAVSNDDVCCIESAIASQVRSEIRKKCDAYLPSNIFPGIFSHVAVVNMETNRDTRSEQETANLLGN